MRTHKALPDDVYTDVRRSAGQWVGYVLKKLRVFRVLVILLVLFILFLVSGLAYLSLVGIPSWFSDRMIAQAKEDGYEVYFRKLTFSVVDGVIAKDVLVYTADEHQFPMLEAGHIILGLSPVEWLRKRLGLRSLRIRDALIRISSRGVILEEDSEDQIQLRNMNANVWFEREHNLIRVEGLRARIMGVPLTGEGNIRFDGRDPEELEKDRTAVHPRLLHQALKGSEAWLPRLLQQVNAIEFTETPNARLAFEWHTTNAALNTIHFEAAGQETRIRGVLFDGWQAAIDLAGNLLKVGRIALDADGGQLFASGLLDVEAQTLEGGISSTLPALYWNSLIPGEWREKLMRSGTVLAGDLDASLVIGPSPINQWLDKITGTLKLQDSELRRVWVEEGEFDFQWLRPVLDIKRYEVMAGKDAGRGLLQGRLEMNFEDKSFEGDMKARINLKTLLPLMDDNQKKVARYMTFRDIPPVFEGAFSGVAFTKGTFVMEADVAATNFVYRGSFLDAMRGHISYSNQVMTLYPLEVERDGGRVDGALTNAFTEKHVGLRVHSTIDPASLIKVIGPNMERIFSDFRFHGSADLKTEGLIDYGDGRDTDYTVEGEVRDFEFNWLAFQQVKLRVEATNRVVNVEPLRGRLFDGDFEGSLRFQPETVPGSEVAVDQSPIRYLVQAAWSNLDFGKVVKRFQEKNPRISEGSFDGSVEYTGVAGRGADSGLSGKAAIRISEGNLWKIPLFGELSEILTRIFPGFGFASQTELTADLELLEDGYHTKNLELVGRLLQVHGEGVYQFNEKLKFDVQVKPLGKNPIGDTVRVLTFPVTSLLNFELEGTIDDPEWRPKNWPSDLLKKFQDVVGAERGSKKDE